MIPSELSTLRSMSSREIIKKYFPLIGTKITSKDYTWLLRQATDHREREDLQEVADAIGGEIV